MAGRPAAEATNIVGSALNAGIEDRQLLKCTGIGWKPNKD